MAQDKHTSKSHDGTIKPADAAKEEPHKAKSIQHKGQNIAQNTRNQGHQQDR